MDHIKASEDSFGRANNYYILMWIVIALITVTAFLDFRTHRLEIQANQQIIDFYGPMENDAARLAQELRSFVYLEPGYENEKAAIDAIRSQRSSLISQIRTVSALMLEKRHLTTDQRVAINTSMNQIGALLMLNDGSMQEAEFPHIGQTEQLLLAEHAAGSYLIADAIQGLRVEDAVRYHWLATLDMPLWLEEFAKLEQTLRVEDDPAEHVVELEALLVRTMSKDFRNVRAFSQKVWTTWITSPNDAISETERRRRKSLTLVQTSQFLEQAQENNTQLALKATGQTSTVTIPVLSIPLQLRDAILVAPMIMIFCAVAIATYTLRALRYAPERKIKNTVIGNLPGYYAFYGLWQPLGIGVAIFLLLAPLAILMFVLPAFIPVLLVEWDWKAVAYFGGCAVAFLFLVIPLSMIPRVIELMKDGIVIMALPAPNFPHFNNENGREGVRGIEVTSSTPIVPSQFVGCWKIITSDLYKYYLRFEKGGRYYISDGKHPFQISTDGTAFDWNGSIWVRHSGTGQTLEGVWDQTPDQLTIAADLSTTMLIPDFTLPGLMDSFGNLSGGDLLYFEQRATFVSVSDFGDGTYEATLQAIFGGVNTFDMELRNGVMILTSPNGDTFKFDSVECSALA